MAEYAMHNIVAVRCYNIVRVIAEEQWQHTQRGGYSSEMVEYIVLVIAARQW